MAQIISKEQRHLKYLDVVAKTQGNVFLEKYVENQFLLARRF